jgi:ribosomal protein L21E
VTYHAASVYGRYQMKGVVRGTRRLFVKSWREGRRFERLAVDSDDFDRFRDGDKIVVGVEPGALGIPWFYGVYRQ